MVNYDSTVRSDVEDRKSRSCFLRPPYSVSYCNSGDSGVQIADTEEGQLKVITVKVFG